CRARGRVVVRPPRALRQRDAAETQEVQRGEGQTFNFVHFGGFSPSRESDLLSLVLRERLTVKWSRLGPFSRRRAGKTQAQYVYCKWLSRTFLPTPERPHARA